MTTWSKYQQAVFENVASGTGHTVITAVAGSGKTTTIVEALGHVPYGCKTLFVAFNKSIANELAKRAPKTVEVSTLHSYGLKTITKSLGRLRINGDRVDHMIRVMYSQRELSLVGALEKLAMAMNVKNPDDLFTFEMRRDLTKTVSLAKGSLASDEADIDAILDGYGIEMTEEIVRKAFIEDALKIMIRCANVSADNEDDLDGQIDFDDMIWLPIVRDLKQTKFDRVFVDETQDLNPAQIEMTMRAVRPGGRICAVGDPRQAIYGFRGADSAAVTNVITRLNAKVLPLSVCYRCCKSVIREAQEIVPEIEWASNAEEGEVNDASVKDLIKNARPGDFVLSRTNAPLISLCLRFLKEGRRANIQGRDIGASLASFVRRSKKKTIKELCDYVEKWRDDECARLAAKNRNTQSVEDRAECILALAEGEESVDAVIRNIEGLFADADDKNTITLSTTHKAKGLERERAWVLQSTYMRRPAEEERFLYYVAITRAKRSLFLVHGSNSER
jgi:DNA helicase-2/ATP-dependent DNA helicase PcrA